MSEKEIKKEEKELEENSTQDEAQDPESKDDLNSLTYEELLEQVNKQKEETLRAVAELENYRKRSSELSLQPFSVDTLTFLKQLGIIFRPCLHHSVRIP